MVKFASSQDKTLCSFQEPKLHAAKWEQELTQLEQTLLQVLEEVLGIQAARVFHVWTELKQGEVVYFFPCCSRGVQCLCTVFSLKFTHV